MNKDTIELKEILDNHSTHYEKVCTNCGECWFGLHCPHDGYQNPCPKCKTTPKQVEFGDCECRGVTFIDDAIEELLAWHNKKVKEARIDELSTMVSNRHYGEGYADFFTELIDSRLAELRRE